MTFLSAIGAIADNWSWILLNECADSTSNDGYRGQVVNGRRKGYGMSQLQNGAYYIGLFQENETTGNGIIVSPPFNYLQHCDSAVYYVGNVLKGKPDGKGKCYDANGKMIYQGLFSKGHPKGEYPMNEINDNHHFMGIAFDDGMYLFGEMTDSVIDGSAFMCSFDGDMWIGKFRNNDITGLSLKITPDGEWESFFVKNGEAIPQSSSRGYEKQRAQQMEVLKTIRDSMAVQSERAMILRESNENRLNQFSRFMEGLAQACRILSSVVSTNGNILSTNETVNGTNLIVGSSGSHDYQGEYDRWTKAAKMHYESLTNTGLRMKDKGKDVSGTNGQSLNTGNYVLRKSSLREAQQQMKIIRQRALRQGITIAKSEYEDITVKY